MIVKKERKSHSEVAHNFRNRFVEPEQLAKPSEEEKIKIIHKKFPKINNENYLCI